MKKSTFFKTAWLFVLVSLICTKALAQNPYSGDLTLSSQAQIDTFNYTEVTGSLTIRGSDIVSLSPLSTLSLVGENMHIVQNNLLINLDGLQNITFVGGNIGISYNAYLPKYCALFPLLNSGGLKGTFFCSDNAVNPTQQDIINGGPCGNTIYNGDLTLTTLEEVYAFNYTEITGSLTIKSRVDDYRFTDLRNLETLTTVGGDLIIDRNNYLINLDGLHNVNHVGRNLNVKHNSRLTNLDGLQGITTVGGSLIIEDHDNLTNLDGLYNTNYVGGVLSIFANNTLTNLNGLQSITSLKESLFIEYNNTLTDISGLQHITSLGKDLTIIGNASLKKIDGLQNIINVGQNLNIFENNILTEFCGLFPLINGGGLTGIYNVSGNSANPTQQEIIDGGPCFSNSPPEARCQDITISANENCLAMVTADDIDNGSFDPDGDEIIKSIFPEGPYSIGTNHVALTIDDGKGETATCEATITVVDNTPPVITCPANILVDCDYGKCDAVINYSIMATDNCGDDITIVNSHESGSSFPVGTTTVTSTATDAAGNMGTCSFSVTVENAIPVIDEVYTGLNEPIQLGTATNLTVLFSDDNANTVRINWGDLLEEDFTNSINVVNAVHTYSSPGVYTITVTIVDPCGETDINEFKYVVIYEPDGNWVTCEGWYRSPQCAFKSSEGISGKAQLSFFAKYRKGSTIPKGQVYFRFKKGKIKFRSSEFDNMRLVVSDYETNFTGTGTINGTGNFGFLISAIDGNRKGHNIEDKFRIKLWDKNKSDKVVYDNNCTLIDDNSVPETVLSKGYIKIHTYNKPKSAETTPIIMPGIENAELRVYPNPFSNKFKIEFVAPETTRARIDIYDINGRLVENLFDTPVDKGVTYNIEFKPNSQVSSAYIYRVVLGKNIYNGKVIYKNNN